MKILLVHSYYTNRGGEDVVFDTTVQLLRDAGHVVHTFTRKTSDASNYNPLKLAFLLFWSPLDYGAFKTVLLQIKPDVVHIHNLFPLISPSILWSVHHMHIPLFYTLHNFRIVCINGLLLRESRPCLKCVQLSPALGIFFRCYRSSILASLLLTASQLFHRCLRTYERTIDHAFALSSFSSSIIRSRALTDTPFTFLPNTVPLSVRPIDSLRYSLPSTENSYVLYVGRLSEEKGISLLLDASSTLPHINFLVIGDTDGFDLQSYSHLRNVRFIGYQTRDDIFRYMSSARCLVIPSLCFENFPCTMVEALAHGLLIVYSKHASLEEHLYANHAGIPFEPGSVCSLKSALQLAWSTDTSGHLSTLATNGLNLYRKKYTRDAVLKQLIGTYSAYIA